jgi:hypothetical protein
MNTEKPLHFLVFLTSLVVFLFFVPNQKLKAQEYSLGIGTDIPYQFYLSFNVATQHIDFNYRTGILTPPYSNVIVSFIGALGVEQIYLDLINTSFQVGWMNSLGGGYKFGKNKKWYLGLEFRLDYLTAADTPKDLVETIINQPIPTSRPTNQPEIKLALGLYATGIRLGYLLDLGNQNRHQLRLEFSFSKHIATQTSLFVNGNQSTKLNQLLNNYMWEDVFKEYGFLGGLGAAYYYRF